MQKTLSVIYASTSGHTEHVVDTLIAALEAKHKDIRIVKQRAERTKPEDLLKSDVTLLACGSWNTNNVEGQLSPYMFELLMKTAAGLDLKGQPCAAIGLGDERYFFTAKAAQHLADYLKNHNGKVLLPTLKIVNEPYGQEDKIRTWADELFTQIDKLPASTH
ncbi:MAG TPA: flavodoxin domain-containing protein [Candidatus Peribacteria bacterium]|nr:flavodoxin domain-containing protein [Candidatus Peribacteria bacterium]